VANYSAPLDILTPLATIAATLEASLAHVATQHALSTQIIEITSATTADTTTYYTASHFGIGTYEGEAVYAYGKYVDTLECVKPVSQGLQGGWSWGGADSQGPCVWRIKRRNLFYMVRRSLEYSCLRNKLTWWLGTSDRKSVNLQLGSRW
jgi:hypothetical protein